MVQPFHSIVYTLRETYTRPLNDAQSLRNSCVHKSPKWKSIQMPINNNKKNEQIHCEIVYCKEKVNYFTKCKKRKETRH